MVLKIPRRWDVTPLGQSMSEITNFRKNNKLDILLLTGSCTLGNTVVETKHTKMNFTSKDSIAGTIRFSDSSFQFIAGLDNYCLSRAFEITKAESKLISFCREPE